MSDNIGIFVSVTVSSVSRLAQIKGKAAFFGTADINLSVQAGPLRRGPFLGSIIARQDPEKSLRFFRYFGNSRSFFCEKGII